MEQTLFGRTAQEEHEVVPQQQCQYPILPANNSCLQEKIVTY